MILVLVDLVFPYPFQTITSSVNLGVSSTIVDFAH
jgi:hypothetical protein